MKHIVASVVFLLACLAPQCHAGKAATAAQITVADKALIAETDARRTRSAVATHLPWGLPVQPLTTTREHLLCQADYVIDYDDDLRIPIWTAYRLRSEDLEHNQPRVEAFRRDPRLKEEVTATLADFAESGYDRGHMAPSACFPQTLTAMLNTFLLSNMTPQRGELNQESWRLLEQKERDWAVKYKRLWVITGAVFDSDMDGKRDPDAKVAKVKGRVGIPTGYYKVFVRMVGIGKPNALAILVPHEDPSRNAMPVELYFTKHLVSVRSIENITGLDFFPRLTKPQQDALEAQAANALWN